MSLGSASSLLAECRSHEVRYEWDEAARCYNIFLEGTPESPDFFTVALRVGNCHEFAAFQQDSVEGYRNRVEVGISVYQEIEQKVSRKTDPIHSQIAKVRRLRLESFLAEKFEQRQMLLDEAIALHSDILEELGRQESKGNWYDASIFHLLLLRDRCAVDNGDRLRELVQEGVTLSKRLTEADRLADKQDIRATAYSFLIFFADTAYHILEDWYGEPNRQSSIVGEALALSPQVQDNRVLVALHAGAAMNLTSLEPAFMSDQVAKALEAAAKTKDKQLLGWAQGTATYLVRWKLYEARDEGEALSRLSEIDALFQEAKKNLGHLSDATSQSYLAFMYEEVVNSRNIIAANFVTEREARRRLIESAVQLFREGEKTREKTSDFHLALLGYMGAEALRQLASLEVQQSRQRQILDEAMSTVEVYNPLGARIYPLFHWHIGNSKMLEGLLRFQLADQTASSTERINLLTSGIDFFRSGLHEINEYTSRFRFTNLLTRAGDFHLRFVKVLDILSGMTNNEKLIDEQLWALDRAEEAYSAAQKPARVAETLWQRAKTQGRSGQHEDASQGYMRACETYRKAAAETPSLRELYDDLAIYMKAWSQIEEARSSHLNMLYSAASRAYQQAAMILGSTERWSPLGDMYSACAILESAEASSHEENPEVAFQLFNQAAKGFVASRSSIASWTPPALREELGSEKAAWETIATKREKYSLALSEVEEAKMLDRKGDHTLSARRFRAAAAILEGLTEQEETLESKQEMRALTLVCRAWQMMKDGEAESAPEKYAQAAHIFEQVSEAAPSGKVIAAARADVAYCRALESGTRLRLTRDTTYYQVTKRYLETAVDYFSEAEMDRASRWTRATERVFDGLIYLAQAETEIDLKEKVRFYDVAERSFQAAAKFFSEASYTGKQAQVEAYLSDLRKQQHIFTSPADALDSSVVLEASEAQVAPMMALDQPHGIEIFETANVQANMKANRSEIMLGESLDVVIEMISAGRSRAILVKLAELAPSGLVVEPVGEKYRVEDGAINLKGLRLDPFETFELQLRFQASSSGEFSLHPRILFLDENGKYGEHQPRPITLTVRELSEGPRKTGGMEAPADTVLEFQTEGARFVFDCLVRAFKDDYMVRRLYVEQAGWRSLTQIAEASKISRRVIYGSQGRYGAPLNELISRGLVETRVFTGHRGRGGEAVKVRIAYEREPVKRYFDQSVMKLKRK